LHSKYDSNEGLGELLETLKNANKQKEVVLTYFQLNASDKKPITVKKLVDTSNSNSAIVKALIEKEILRIIIYKRTVLILRENQGRGITAQ
jgi:primosomal protein N' (replication factor Y)